MKIILLLVALLPLCAQYAAAQQLTWELRAGERLLLQGTDSGRTDTVRITAADMSRLSEIKIRFQACCWKALVPGQTTPAACPWRNCER